MDPRRRALVVVAIVAVIAVAALALWAGLGSRPRSPAEREAAAQQLLAGLRITPTLVSSDLIAGSAVSDLGVTGGVQLVHVRIVDRMRLELRLDSPATITFAKPPGVCLVGPFSAPDDAGLSDPCWGEPDLATFLAPSLATDGAGHPSLPGGPEIGLSVDLARGDVRCDYPPGQWVVELKLDPVIDGIASGARYLPDVPFDVPFATSAPLQLVPENRYCGLATVVYRQQGEPPLQSP